MTSAKSKDEKCVDYPSCVDFLKKEYKYFIDFITDSCINPAALEQTYSGKYGITFIIPAKKTIEKIKKDHKGLEKQHIAALHIVKTCLSDGNKWGEFPTLNRKVLDVEDKSEKELTFKGGVKATFKMMYRMPFGSFKMAIWEISDDKYLKPSDHTKQFVSPFYANKESSSESSGKSELMEGGRRRMRGGDGDNFRGLANRALISTMTYLSNPMVNHCIYEFLCRVLFHCANCTKAPYTKFIFRHTPLSTLISLMNLKSQTDDLISSFNSCQSDVCCKNLDGYLFDRNIYNGYVDALLDGREIVGQMKGGAYTKLDDVSKFDDDLDRVLDALRDNSKKINDMYNIVDDDDIDVITRINIAHFTEFTYYKDYVSSNNSEQGMNTSEDAKGLIGTLNHIIKFLDANDIDSTYIAVELTNSIAKISSDSDNMFVNYPIDLTSIMLGDVRGVCMAVYKQIDGAVTMISESTSAINQASDFASQSS